MGRREEGPHLITGCGAGLQIGGQYVSANFVRRQGSAFFTPGGIIARASTNHFFDGPTGILPMNPASRAFAARYGYGKKHYSSYRRKGRRGTYSFSKASRKGCGHGHSLQVIGVTANSRS
jgi:hypothetical protein